MTGAQRWLSRAEVREVERRAIEDLGIAEIVLMENAGRGAAQIVHEHWRGAGVHIVLCGGGNNGGDGFVIARHLLNRGVETQILTACDPARLPAAAAANHAILVRMGAAMHAFGSAAEIDAHGARPERGAVIIDALLGTGFHGVVRAPLKGIIERVNALHDAGAGMAAVDVPSGLDCDTGIAEGPAVRADVTMTFVASKIGFTAAQAQEYLGEVRVVDIGAPV